MPLEAIDRAADAIKLDLHDHALSVIECLEALLFLATAANHPGLKTELDEMHGVMVRISARIHKLSLTPPTHHESIMVEE
jgi:hypothetical protein